MALSGRTPFTVAGSPPTISDPGWCDSRAHIVPLLFVLLITLLQAACSGTTRAPVVSRSTGEEARPGVSSSQGGRSVARDGRYTVKKGDTLYSIAWKYALDYRRLAAWNGIPEPYVIYPGQQLRLQKPANKQRARDSGAKPAGAAPKRPAASATPDSRDQSIPQTIQWRWPTAGQLIKLDTPIARKGISISGRQGQPVSAAADGRVVYSGSGLLGYGKLIIIKHNDVYLSAYAHNDTIHVKEGDRVTVGQKIATMGQGNNGQPVLHFEIRKDGKPVPPLTHLPASRS